MDIVITSKTTKAELTAYITDLLGELAIARSQLTGAHEELQALKTEFTQFKAAAIELGNANLELVKVCNDYKAEIAHLRSYVPSAETVWQREAMQSDDTTDETGMPTITHKTELLRRLSRVPSKGLQNPLWELITVRPGNEVDSFLLSFTDEYYKANREKCFKFFQGLLTWCRENAKALRCNAGTRAGRPWIRIEA